MVPVFDNVDTFLAKSYYPVHIFSVVSKIFEKFVNNNLVDCIQIFGRFSDFHNCLRSFRSTADHFIVFAKRISCCSGALRAVLFDTKAILLNFYPYSLSLCVKLLRYFHRKCLHS